MPFSLFPICKGIFFFHRPDIESFITDTRALIDLAVPIEPLKARDQQP
jgi:hypothetical protein